MSRKSRGHGRPSPSLCILTATCALFAIFAWGRSVLGGGDVARLGSDALPLASKLPPRHARTLLLPQAPSQSAAVAKGGQCSLTRPARRLPDEPRIAAAITSSRRPLLFRRAMLSFRMRCLDCIDRVDQWFAVDDGSSPEEMAHMRAAVPGLTWIDKAPGAHGHTSSLNALLTAVWAFDYVVFIEDDFLFVQDLDFVSASLAVLDTDPHIGQVVFNARYALTSTSSERNNLVGGDEVRDPASGRTTHIIHEYVGPGGSPEWNAFFQRPGNGGKVANVHWPHFSLHSGVWRMSAMRANGLFQDKPGFEYEYGLRWMEKGFKTAFLPGVFCVHLGKPVNGAVQDADLDAMFSGYGLRHTVNGTASAYDLNGTIRRRR